LSHQLCLAKMAMARSYFLACKHKYDFTFWSVYAVFVSR
jgi:hypothetical protein